MKKLFLCLCLALAALFANGQTCEIPMRVMIHPNQDGLTTQHINYLKNVLDRALVTGNGVVQIANPQFGIQARVDVVDKHIIAGAPTKPVLNLSVAFFIGDFSEGLLFANYTMEVAGVGDNETKAYNSAIHRVSAQNRDLAAFIVNGKQKVIEWYNNNYVQIIKKSQRAVSLNSYEEALYYLLMIPECCNGYEEAMAYVKIIYQQYIDRKCEESLALAQAAWMSGYSKENAKTAAAILAEIDPDASCKEEVNKLVAEIKGHLSEEWAFEQKQWDDTVSVESQRLTNAKEIAMAYAQNQPTQVIHSLY